MRQLYEGFKKTVVAAGICICCLGLTACGKKEAQQAVEQETVQMQENETVGKQAADGADDLKNAEADKETENRGTEHDADTQSSTDVAPEVNEKDAAAEQKSMKNGDYILARPSQNGALSVKGTQLVDEKGNMAEETPFAGLFVKKADPEVLKDLDARGLLYDAPKFEHDYPHCWRCDTPLIYYARESWYIKETAVRDDLIRNNNTVNWIPESIGKGRFGNWLENIQDWAISRNRYWGTPLNIWECEGCGHLESIGSRAELAERSGNPDDAKVELHRPYIDAVTFTCPDCGKTMKRVPEVIDCWFDSGAMPFAQHHYPFENQELFKQQFPAQFAVNGVGPFLQNHVCPPVWFRICYYYDRCTRLLQIMYTVLVPGTILFYRVRSDESADFGPQRLKKRNLRVRLGFQTS